MTRIKEAIAKLETMMQTVKDADEAGSAINPYYVEVEVKQILALLNVDDKDWKPS